MRVAEYLRALSGYDAQLPRDTTAFRGASVAAVVTSKQYPRKHYGCVCNARSKTNVTKCKTVSCAVVFRFCFQINDNNAYL